MMDFEYCHLTVITKINDKDKKNRFYNLQMNNK